MRGAAIGLALLLAGCAHPLLVITVPSYMPPQPRDIAKAELHAAQAAPACLGVMGLLMLGVGLGVLPWPASEAALVPDGGASYLGKWCN